MIKKSETAKEMIGDMHYVRPFYIDSHGMKTSPKPREGYVLHPAFKRIRRRCERRTVSRFRYTRKRGRGLYVGIYERLDGEMKDEM